MDRELQNRYPKRMLKIDRIPRRSKFNALKPRNIEAREKGFDTYLRQLLNEGELLASPEFREFLEIPLEAAFSDDDFDEPATAKSDGSDLLTELSQASTAGTGTPSSSARVASWQIEAEAKWGGDGRLSSLSLPLVSAGL